MSDFFLDFRPLGNRNSGFATKFLRFYEDTEVYAFSEARFSLILTRCDDPKVWAPFVNKIAGSGVLVALVGRIALDRSEWELAEDIDGDGGLACKYIFSKYTQKGISSLFDLNGNFTVLIYDQRQEVFHIITDRCGMALAYSTTSESFPVYSSHPDLLAKTTGQSEEFDETSLAQFLMTGSLTPPNTYYRRISVLESGSNYSVSLESSKILINQKKHFSFQFSPSLASEDKLAAQFSEAFINAVRRRSLPLFGTTAVALSGGLDSRTILSMMNDPFNARVFSLFDEENIEIKIAKRIADHFSIPLNLIERDFDYYGRAMEKGVRILGGISSLASNHFLGIREKLKQLGFTNLLTGCFCDYIFKALALNTTESRFLRVQKLGTFKFDFYRPHCSISTAKEDKVRSRLHQYFPEVSKAELSETDWFEVERKRCFPLAYEGDSAQRVIPQRVLPWYVPVVDNEILSLYQQLPSKLKLNSSFFRKLMAHACPNSVLNIPDSNTGARVQAGMAERAIRRYTSAAANKFTRLTKRGIATRGSWPNWNYYISQSKMVEDLWSRRQSLSRELFNDLLGYDPFKRSLPEWGNNNVELFVRLMTLKLWLEGLE
jgi:asparagine synthase (glutamine-hydrolysing)